MILSLVMRKSYLNRYILENAVSVDINGIVLKSILKEPEKGLEIWPKLKLSYFSSSYTGIFTEISRYYTKHSKLPNFNELSIVTRNQLLKTNLKALEKLDIPEDIDLDIALEGLVNEYTQNETLDKLDNLLNKITMLDYQDIIKEISDISMFLEEKTHSNEDVYLMSDMLLLDVEYVTRRVPLGLNNTHDAQTLGCGIDDLILIGGMRGSGKSVICCNIAINQYLQGNVVPYFTIEMRAKAVHDRIMSALAEIDHQDLSTNRSSKEDIVKLVKAKADMFIESDDLYNKFLGDNDYDAFEAEIANRKLKDNRIILIDNQQLTLSDIDLNLHKMKAKYGDKLKVVVVDYLNAINIENVYDWGSQLQISKVLKDLAEKHEVIMVAPFQINKDGDARFSKAIEDKADIVCILDAKPNRINIKSTKTRNIPAFEYGTEMNWKTLRLSGNDAVDEKSEDNDEIIVKGKEEDLPF